MEVFPSSRGNKYILVTIDYVPKWVEAFARPINDSRVVVHLLKRVVFHHFGVPLVHISDNGAHFIKKRFGTMLKKYGSHHKYRLGYHFQTNGQVEISNRKIKVILEKTIA